MKHHQFKPREFRGFIQPTKPLPKHIANAVALTEPQSVLALALAVQTFFDTDPFRRVLIDTRIRGGQNEAGSTEIRPAFFVVEPSPDQAEIPPGSDLYDLTTGLPSPTFVFDVSPPGFRGWRERAADYLERYGVSECFFFVSGAASHLSYRAFRVKDGELAVVSQWSKLWHSSTLLLDFAVRDDVPCVFNPRNGERLPTPVDTFNRRFR